MLDSLTLADAPAAAALSAGFGWPHRQQDWATFLTMAQGVCWRENGALMGTAITFIWGPGHGAIGGVQVAPALQGRGIGRKLMQAAIAAAEGRALALHSTVEGAPLYASLGFQPAGVVQQWQGIARDIPPTRAARNGTASPALDAGATGVPRDAMLTHWAQDANIATTPTGFAMRRKFGRGELIGPIIAPDPTTALDLVAALAQPGAFTRLDLFEPTPDLCAGLTAIGLTCVDTVQRMTRPGATTIWPTPTPLMVGLMTQATG